MALVDNIWAYFKCEEASGNLADATGNGNTATADGTTYYQETGIIDYGVGVNRAANSRFDLNQKLSAIGAALTFNFWIYHDASTASSYLMQTDNGGYKPDIQINSKKIYISVGGSSWDTGIAVPDTTYCMITVTFASGTWSVYLNAGSKATNGGSLSDGNNMSLLNHSASSAQGLEGEADEIGIWERALTDAEVTELYNGGAGLQYPFEAAGTNIQLNIADTWVDIDGIKINIADAWVDVTGAQINIADAWVTIF